MPHVLAPMPESFVHRTLENKFIVWNMYNWNQRKRKNKLFPYPMLQMGNREKHNTWGTAKTI